MRKTNLLILFLLLISMSVNAQDRRITGTIIDNDTKEAVMQVTIQLLKTDSSFVSGTLSNEQGTFSIAAPSDGSFILKITSVGYKTIHKNVEIKQEKDVALGKIAFNPDAIMLKETTVTAQAAKVVVVEDTFIYNAAAYRVPEGSVIEELVKKLPGADVDENGTITINGKTVKKVKVDGKEFMTGDTKIAMKNLPTAIVEKVKAYDEKSDLARITGIDDGDESTVLDFGLKPGMHKGVFANADLGVGTKHRYSEKVMGSYMNSKARLMGFGSANNVNDRGFPGGGGGGRFGGGGRGGLTAAKMIGINFNYEEKDKLNVDGSLAWNHSDSDSKSETSAENFVSTVGSFSNSLSQSFSRSNNIDLRLKVEWRPDKLTNIIFNPNINYSTGDGRSVSSSASYNQDPYLYVTDPLNDEDIATLAAENLMVNSRSNQSVSNNDRLGVGSSLQLNRKLNDKGRNLTLKASINYDNNGSKSLSESNVHLFQVKNIAGNDSTYLTNRYNLTPSKSWSYVLQSTYSEPIFKNVFLQFNYQFNYRYNKSDRSTYDFSLYDYRMLDSFHGKYGGWDEYFLSLGYPLDYYREEDLSRFSEYSNYVHELNTTLRVVREKYQLTAGFMVQPQKSHYVQHYQGVNTDTVRTVVNFTPTMTLRYRFSKQSRLQLDYRGRTSHPSIEQLLDITDDSDPLNISMGNPGLKSAFTSNMRMSYNNYFQKHQQSISVNAGYSNTRNSISNMVTYNEATGGRTTRPENINGNWNGNIDLTFSSAIDTAGIWNMSSSTSLNYNNRVGYLYQNDLHKSVKNITRTTAWRERLQLSYRKDWFEITADGTLNYSHTRNLLQSQNNLDTWQFSYGASMNIFAPWGMSLSTDMHEQSRRGYSDATMNTNELIWNAQLSQSFLKGKPLTVTLQFYDLLHQQSNFSRTINEMRRSDTQYNAITSYAMLHVIYRFNAFGGKEGRRAMRGLPRGFDDSFRDRSRGGMGPRGGGGGNRGGGMRGGGGFGGGFGGGR
ncbi:MAG: TonB-dependent receptor [Prevotella sp.]|nr:TonB-dependent receptor [Prevotella sp.]